MVTRSCSALPSSVISHAWKKKRIQKVVGSKQIGQDTLTIDHPVSFKEKGLNKTQRNSR